MSHTGYASLINTIIIKIILITYLLTAKLLYYSECTISKCEKTIKKFNYTEVSGYMVVRSLRFYGGYHDPLPRFFLVFFKTKNRSAEWGTNTVHNTKENTNNNRNVKIGKYVTKNHYISITYEIKMSDFARCVNWKMSDFAIILAEFAMPLCTFHQ